MSHALNFQNGKSDGLSQSETIDFYMNDILNELTGLAYHVWKIGKAQQLGC